MTQVGSLWGIGGQWEVSYLHRTSRRQCMNGIWEGSGRNCPPRQMGKPVFSIDAPKWQTNPSWCLGENCPSCNSPLVKKLEQLSTAWGTDPAQHPRKGLGGGSKGPAASVAGTCISALVTCDGTDFHFLKMGGLLSYLPPSPGSIAGAGTDQTLLLMVPISIPSGLGCRHTLGDQVPQGSNWQLSWCLQLQLAWGEDEECQI